MINSEQGGRSSSGNGLAVPKPMETESIMYINEVNEDIDEIINEVRRRKPLVVIGEKPKTVEVEEIKALTRIYREQEDAGRYFMHKCENDANEWSSKYLEVDGKLKSVVVAKRKQDGGRLADVVSNS